MPASQVSTPEDKGVLAAKPSPNNMGVHAWRRGTASAEPQHPGLRFKASYPLGSGSLSYLAEAGSQGPRTSYPEAHKEHERLSMASTPVPRA